MTRHQSEILSVVLLCGMLTAPVCIAYALWRRGYGKSAWLAVFLGAIAWNPAFWPITPKSTKHTLELYLVCGALSSPFVGGLILWQRGERIAVLLVAFVGLCLWVPIIVPPGSLMPASERRERICGGGQGIIMNAKYLWAHRTKQPDDAVPQPADLIPHFLDGVMPVCPEGGTYILGAVNERTRCSLPHHNRGRRPRACITQPLMAYADLGTYTLGAVNEPPRCSHADKGHALPSTSPAPSR